MNLFYLISLLFATATLAAHGKPKIILFGATNCTGINGVCENIPARTCCHFRGYKRFLSANAIGKTPTFVVFGRPFCSGKVAMETNSTKCISSVGRGAAYFPPGGGPGRIASRNADFECERSQPANLAVIEGRSFAIDEAVPEHISKRLIDIAVAGGPATDLTEDMLQFERL